LIWIKTGAAVMAENLINEIESAAPARPPVRHCPVCGVAMLASKSRDNLAEFDTFRCLNCDTIISKPAPPPATR
jgi:hypothetical protein